MGKKVTPHISKMASGALVSLMMAESAACENMSHFREMAVFFLEEMCINLAVQHASHIIITNSSHPHP